MISVVVPEERHVKHIHGVARRARKRNGTTAALLLVTLLLAGCGAMRAADPDVRVDAEPTSRPTAMDMIERTATMVTVATEEPVAQPRPSGAAVEPALQVAEGVRGGNVRNLPSTQGSMVMDQIGEGEAVIVRRRTPNSQWY